MELVPRILTEDDAQQYYTLRMRSLTEHPESFGSSVQEEEIVPIEAIQQSLRRALPDRCFVGIFAEEALIGIGTLARFPRVKNRHRAMVSAMYVVPEYRGHGVGGFLLDILLKQARVMPDLEDIVIGVTVGNDAARKLYVRAGFKTYGVDPRYMKIEGKYYDLEWMIRPVEIAGETE